MAKEANYKANEVIEDKAGKAADESTFKANQAVDESIFKAYDIRGIYPKQLNEEIAERIGKAFVKFTKARKVFIGRDCRESSESLFEALAKGINAMGADVIDIGLSSTPMFYFAAGLTQAEAGVIITASHNPPEYNGFKLCKKGTIPVSGDTGIMDLKELVKKNEFREAKKQGIVERKKFFEEYEKFFVHHAKEFGLNVVVDCANAMGIIEAKILGKLCNMTGMFMDFDGSFPSHEPNPLKEKNLQALKKKVLEEKADLGIGLDGDADRMIFVDEKGETVRGDFITALLARNFSNEKILYEIRSSKVVGEEIEKAGNQAIRCRAGHALIKEQMRKIDAAFAGELSGHYYFKEMFFAEAPLKTAIELFKLVEGKKLSKLVEGLKKYHQSGEINFSVEDKAGKLMELEEKYSGGKISKIDGLTVEFKDWWFNIRPSNTEPLLRLNLEADSKKLVKEKVEELKQGIGGVIE